MHLHFRARFLGLLVLAVIFFFRGEFLGLALEPVLQNSLTDLFGTEVTVRGLQADPLTGQVSAKELMILNQKGFTRRPHLKARLEFKIHFMDLLRRRVRIDSLILHEAYFLIEKRHWERYEELNIKAWIHHMEAQGEKDAQKDAGASVPWKVTIERLILDSMVFIYENRSGKQIYKRYVFQDLHGAMDHFEWPVQDPRKLTQPVSVWGWIGLGHPAPVWVKGRANFASSKISFDLNGEIRGGSLTEYRHFWTGLPLKVVGGHYDLIAHAVCEDNRLRWDNDLVLHNVRLKSKRTAAALIWGLPIKASVRFMESQQTIFLRVPVEGDISDPNYSPAFKKAFQDSLTRYIQASAGAFKSMAQKGEVVAEAPVKIVGETFGKVSTLVKTAAADSAKALNKEDKSGVR